MSPAAAAFDTSSLPDYAYDWVLVDVETSGLIARRDRILSVALVTIGPDGTQTGEYSTLLNPGCDPGPVHVHGLTTERLRGAPTFAQVAGRIGSLLQDRILVAHNAQFDYDFLAHEFARARLHLPVTQRLCTLALNRRVEPPTADLSLASLAAHYGVPQNRAHDAVDDTRVLAGVFRASLSEAARLDLPLPLVSCPPRQDPQFAPKPPKTPCAYRNPGRLRPGGPLVQGMKIAVTGETATSRAELVARSVAAGLNVMTSVSRHTSALVTNDAVSGSAKARRAIAEGVPIVDERDFLMLLQDVRRGTPHEKPTPEEPPATTAPAVPPATAAAVHVPAGGRSEPVQAAKPFGRRRVLVLGGTHDEAASARARVVELGGAAAINLSASVTDVVLLPGGERDRRMARVTALGLPVRSPAWLGAPVPEPVDAPPRNGAPADILPRGGVIDLPAVDRWYVGASWARRADCGIDVVAFVLDEEEQVSCDGDFVFYGAPESPDGAVRLLCDGPTEQTVAVDLGTLPPAAHRIAVAAAIDGGLSFGDVGAVQVTLASGADATSAAQAALDAATSERTLLLAEIYRRGPMWRFRAVGQGYDHGLEDLARGYGVDVE
ncbi:TerD family protein [Streptomyces somaliensis DSM 40738]|uniref:DNA polymerase III n=1 Tax=Streptomyces somaliensis (strain ATCC 33201 / DSM 40738 / JCM 12659 / KCTC 9044 / NCTC 11332 / NRRL B-12077 / IP 733) TaxID=1134445 RepID=A0AA44DEL8_STRE0|nr:TerD family protein [Streptomyces somaliensis]MCQ0022769.1 TerD family protein [Streptomyces somaliensis DSM 40738]NKY15541.1 DNA polymerase III [Streptomyces somaliensis DSM 40738]